MPQENSGLKSLALKRSYDPSVDGSDVVNDFYIPCLSKSIKYDRCSAYFSSAVLKQFALGLYDFYKNGGHARFIFSCEISEDEMANIVNAYSEKMNDMSNSLDDSLDNDFEVANLAYLIKHNLADVKIAFMVKYKSALMHIKSGLFEDTYGNKVYFDGSGNETDYGVSKNAEVFNVFNNFNGDNGYLNDGENRFNRLWDNTYSPSTIRTEYPCGKLFEKLCSYSKEKLFSSKEEFYENKNCVLIDINLDKQLIILNDYTSNNLLFKYPAILKTFYKEHIVSAGQTLFFIDRLTLHDLRDLLPQFLGPYGIDYIYSDAASIYINSQDLKLNKRIKLAESIKTKQNEELWLGDFERFKQTINHEMEARLKDKQYENAYHHLAMKSSMDFSVPGTGKTYISYGLFAYLYSSFLKKQSVDHLVVFGPLNCFKAWKEECQTIFGNKHHFSIFDVTEHRADFENQIKNKKYHIYLINYEFVTEQRIDLIGKCLLNDRTFLVFDEIHKLKSIKGMRANNIISMLDNAPSKPLYKLALTGTPLPNSFSDLYNYLKILYSDDLNGFLKVFSINQLNQADTNPMLAKTIRENLHPLFTRTTKKDLNIPPANNDDITTLCVEPTIEEEKLYDFIHRNYKNPLLKFIRLIQASSNPRLLLSKIDVDELDVSCDYDTLSLNSGAFDDETNYQYQEEQLIKDIGMSSKTRKTIEFVKEKSLNGEKLIVWCLFIDTIDLVKRSLEECGISCVTISGRDDAKTRDSKIDSFKYGVTQVLITNPNTLAESVSLHLTCHNAIYLEYGFNLTYMLQSKDRIHRVGLKEGTITNYYYAISDSSNRFGSIDKRVYYRLQMKADRMKETIESNDIILVNDSSDYEDIRYILGMSDN